MIATRTVEPTAEPITTSEVKTRIVLSTTTYDTQIGTLIKAARRYFESFTGRALVQQTWKYYLSDWPDGDFIKLPHPPLQSVTAVRYTDSDDSQSTLSTDDYSVDTDSEPGRVVLNYGETWPTATLATNNPIEIEFVAGYDPGTSSPVDYAENIPEGIKDAMMLMVGLLQDLPPEGYSRRMEEVIHSILGPYLVRDEF